MFTRKPVAILLTFLLLCQPVLVYAAIDIDTDTDTQVVPRATAMNLPDDIWPLIVQHLEPDDIERLSAVSHALRKLVAAENLSPQKRQEQIEFALKRLAVYCKQPSNISPLPPTRLGCKGELSVWIMGSYIFTQILTQTMLVFYRNSYFYQYGIPAIFAFSVLLAISLKCGDACVVKMHQLQKKRYGEAQEQHVKRATQLASLVKAYIQNVLRADASLLKPDERAERWRYLRGQLNQLYTLHIYTRNPILHISLQELTTLWDEACMSCDPPHLVIEKMD